MEDTYRIIYALCIIFLRFPSYYLAPTQLSIPAYTDVISNDTNLCNDPIKQALLKSEYTKDCTKLRYPQDINKLTLQNENIETFLCLGMHDAIYKLCQYINQQRWAIHSKEEVDLSIQKVFKLNPNDRQEEFCKNLSGFTPMYEKIKPATSKLAELLQNSKKCNKMCFDINDNLNPMCMMLAWVNGIDQTVKKNKEFLENSKLKNLPNDITSGVAKSTKNQEKKKDQVGTSVQESQVADTGNQKPLEIVTGKESVQKPALNADHSKPSQNAVDINKNNDSNKQGNAIASKTVPPPDVADPVEAEKESEMGLHDEDEKPKSPVTNAQQSFQTDDKKDDTKNNDKEPNTDKEPATESKPSAEKTPSIIDKTINDKTISPSTEEVKPTTISDNTQDNVNEDTIVNNLNPDDSSRIDDDQIPNSFDNGGNQFADTVNRNENVPETSGRGDLDFYGMKNDEESHFFSYFAIILLGFIACYIGYHNKQKILAIVLEGRRSKNNRGRRRPSTANYRKLDCTLEEAVTSQCNANVTHVIY